MKHLSFHLCSKLLGIFIQLIILILKFPHCICIWISYCSISGSKSRLLQVAAKPAAAVEHVILSISFLSFLAERIHYLLSHHEDQFAVGYEDQVAGYCSDYY